MTEHIQVVPDKCRACRRCEVACIAAHHGMSFKEAMKHRDELVSRVQVVKADGFKTTVRCHQCPHAPCVNVCPTGALQQDEQGRIIMRVQYCVACKMCMAACPYGTITMETIGMPAVDGEDGETIAQRARREVAVRCDMCRAWRMQNGKRITACMEACPAHALSLVLADGTIVEAPKPEKKAVAAKPEAPKAEAAPESGAQAATGTEAAAAEKNRPASNEQEAAVTPATPAPQTAPADTVAPVAEKKDPAPEAEKADAGETEKKSVAETAPAAQAKADEPPAEQTQADAAPAAKNADDAAPAPAAAAEDAPVSTPEAAPQAPAEPVEPQTAAKAEEAPKAVHAPEPTTAEKKPAAVTKAEKKPATAAKKPATKSSKKAGKKSGKK
ncbi:4Fe-4S dicluster domain-containing protein [Desulfovibrio sp.]|uniref:4Fe-4S dicluster domain-containing protein n=1 Tax=Desulfovibrio sp. TaxID=885 RepID=UPI0025BF4059|nr:4Fe-4S dicluster domain-containing protein [Desulfovibrio sp.]